MIKLISLLLTSICFYGLAHAKEISLPEPSRHGGAPLMEALSARRSVKSFSNKEIDNQHLSNILWVAYGINSDDGRRTIATARNMKDLDIIAVRKDGAWRYDAENNALQLLTDKNLLPLFSTQDYMEDVPLVLVYIGSNDEDYPLLHAGSAYQNVELYAASAGLGSVVRGYYDKDAVNKALDMPENQAVLISQAVGWRK